MGQQWESGLRAAAGPGDGARLWDTAGLLQHWKQGHSRGRAQREDGGTIRGVLEAVTAVLCWNGADSESPPAARTARCRPVYGEVSGEQRGWELPRGLLWDGGKGAGAAGRLRTLLLFCLFPYQVDVFLGTLRRCQSLWGTLRGSLDFLKVK